MHSDKKKQFIFPEYFIISRNVGNSASLVSPPLPALVLIFATTFRARIQRFFIRTKKKTFYSEPESELLEYSYNLIRLAFELLPELVQINLFTS